MHVIHSPRIICLSNVFEQAYHELRKEKIEPCLSWGKRRDLFRCIEWATGRELIVLSAPPKAIERRSPKWLPAQECKFSTHRQLFCCNFDMQKIRVPLSWFFYALHVFKNVRNRDIVVIDNYELLYVIAARLVAFWKRVDFVLEFEDGKHLTDQSWAKLLSGLAEKWGKSLPKIAILAHPALGDRLPASVPKELVPGFITNRYSKKEPSDREVVRFLYSGSLDHARGLEMLIETLPLLPESGWELHISGAGPLEQKIATVASDDRWKCKIFFHGRLPAQNFNDLLQQCHVGINCQRSSDPISGVTFPSKIFTYISSGLLVISSRASQVDKILGNACFYYEEETPKALAGVMSKLIKDFRNMLNRVDVRAAEERYSIEGTALRLKALFKPLINIEAQ